MGANEKCGLFGAVIRRDHPSSFYKSFQSMHTIGKVAYAGLVRLQHRGQESAGIAVDGGNQGFTLVAGSGTMDWVFRPRVPTEATVEFVFRHFHKGGISRAETAHILEQWWIDEHNKATRNIARRRWGGELEETVVHGPTDGMQGLAAIGHVRYSTSGESTSDNIHPIEFSFKGKRAAVAHNGNLVRLEKLRAILEERGGYTLQGTTDTELIAALVSTSPAETFEAALRETLPLLEGAFCLVFLYGASVYAATDRFGIRPLCIGQTGDYFFVASESRALDGLRAKFLAEVAPGTLVCMRPENMTKNFWTGTTRKRGCVFEHIYFSMPDTILQGKRVYFSRKAMGRELAGEHPMLDTDIIIPILDSAVGAALGYSQAMRDMHLGYTLFETGLIRDHYVQRTFMRPIEDERELLQYLKHSGIPELIRDKIVTLVDDSIVRGNASKAVVDMMRYLGARKVYFVVASPPLHNPCHLGVDIPTHEELAAYNRSIEEVRAMIGADYLGYLSLEGLHRAIGLPRMHFCDGCFTGEYPVEPEAKSTATITL